jgi:lipopolysaccharide transport system permease protein
VPRHRERAVADFRDGLGQWRLALRLARLDLRNRYRGSVLGPLWMTASAAVMIAGLGLVYGALFRIPLADYLPHLAVSLIVWQWISGCAMEACVALTGAEGVIRQVRLPYTVHALRLLFRQSLTAAHSLPLIAIVFVIFGHLPGPEALLAAVGLGLILVNILAGSLLLGMVCARFRDVAQIVSNAVQFAFFVTPILWKAELLGDRAVWLVLNPFYVLLETVRGPLIAGGGPLWVWPVALLYTAALVAVSAAFFARFRARIAFWV